MQDSYSWTTPGTSCRVRSICASNGSCVPSSFCALIIFVNVDATEIHFISVHLTVWKLRTLHRGMSLIATDWRSVLRRANSTCPNPPCPMWRPTKYLSSILLIADVCMQHWNAGRTFITVIVCTVLQYEWWPWNVDCSILIGLIVHGVLAICVTAHISGKLQFEEALCKRVWVEKYKMVQCKSVLLECCKITICKSSQARNCVVITCVLFM